MLRMKLDYDSVRVGRETGLFASSETARRIQKHRLLSGLSVSQVQEALALLDVADVSFLLQALVMEGVLRCSSLLLPQSRRRCVEARAPADVPCELQRTASEDEREDSAGQCGRQTDTKREKPLLTAACPQLGLHASVLSGSLVRPSPANTALPRTPIPVLGRGEDVSGKKRSVDRGPLVDDSKQRSEATGGNSVKRPRLAVAVVTARPSDSKLETGSRPAWEDPTVMSRIEGDARTASFALPSEEMVKKVVFRARALALEATTLYFPEKAEAVLPLFSELLLPRACHVWK